MRNEGRATPLVTVVMPAYNAETYIEEAIRSVLNQTVEDLELIVIDDCSTDGTRICIEKLAKEDLRIRTVCNEKNLGVAHTRNKGLDIARGSYVALLDCDDIWYPKKLEKQLKIAQDTNTDIVYCGYAMIDDTGKKICEDFFVPPVTTFDDMLIQSVISCSTALLTREVADHYRFGSEYYHEDYVLWLQMLRDGKRAAGIAEPQAAYRVLTNSRASNKISSALRRWKIYRGYLGYSFFRSTWLLFRYAILGTKKYRRC